MNLSPKEQGQLIPSIAERLPVTLDEAVEYLESKFASVSASVLHYEEEKINGEMIRAVHTTYAVGGPLEPDTPQKLITAWLISMMDCAINSSRTKLWWRMKPQLSIEMVKGVYQLHIMSRSSMI